jgi:pimeloyl-ACP methyl ester carboxylesterase
MAIAPLCSRVELRTSFLIVHAETLVILPGLLCGPAMFAESIAAFPSTVVVDDFYADAASIEAMAAIALDRAPPRFSLMGHSMGARVALEITRLAPQRVARLALANTGIHPVRPGERQKRQALSLLGHEAGFDALVAQWLPPMVGKRQQQDGALMERMRAMCASAGQAVYDRQITALLNRPDPTALLSHIRCPVFVIVGEDDVWSPPAQHEEIASHIAGAQLRVVPNAGHMLPAEDPLAFNTILQEWMATADREIG